MRKIITKTGNPKFVPDYTASSIEDVDFLVLQKIGIRYIAFDADSTLVHFGARVMPESAKLHLHKHKRKFEKWCIASNRLTNDLVNLGKSIDASVVRATILNRKPYKRYYSRVLSNLGAKPSETAMIGDKLIADMWGAKRSGLTTVWVERIGPDNPLDSLFFVRKLESKLMRAYQPHA